MFKDAYRQEAIFDKVRAVEFEMESAASAEVGSLINEVSAESSGFERIADEDGSSNFVLKHVAAVRHDRSDAGANGVAFDDRDLSNAHVSHVSDGIQRTGLKYSRCDAEVSRAWTPLRA